MATKKSASSVTEGSASGLKAASTRRIEPHGKTTREDAPTPVQTGRKKRSSRKPIGASVEPKRVRDRFTMPEVEHARLRGLKQRAERLQHPAKKSELLRAGIQALMAMKDKAFLAALNTVAEADSADTTRPSHRAGSMVKSIRSKQV